MEGDLDNHSELTRRGFRNRWRLRFFRNTSSLNRKSIVVSRDFCYLCTANRIMLVYNATKRVGEELPMRFDRFNNEVFCTSLLNLSFADSYSSWQKGAIENANKLIRQYIPKGTDFATLTDEFIRRIQYKINRRPRKKLNFESPKVVFFRQIANFAVAG